MYRNTWASKSIEELWAIREQVTEILEVRLTEEKQELERRLVRLHAAPEPERARRPYPPVLPKYANPDRPNEVWSGRGKQPRWVAEKLASGLALRDLSIKDVAPLRLKDEAPLRLMSA